ncbi:MAG: YkvA family protein [Acuticoccus sp.]
MSAIPRDGEILPPEPTPEETARNEKRVRQKFWHTLKRAARQIPFTHDLVAAYYCALDPAVPFRVRATLLGALAYFIAPIDVVPDLLLGVGFTDDAAVLMAAITMVASHISPHHRERAEKALAD